MNSSPSGLVSLSGAGAAAAAAAAPVGAREMLAMLLPASVVSAKSVDARVQQPLRIALCVMLIQQFSGINAVIFYAGDILGEAGVSNRDLGGAIVMAIQCCATGVACLLVDRLGRRVLLLGSLAGMSLSAVLLALYFSLGDKCPPEVSILALVSYIVSFSLGLGPIPWLLMPEILPLRARGIASSAATCLNWLCAFTVTEFFATINKLLKPQGTFLLFAAVCFAGALYVRVNVPETKGKTLDQVADFFAPRHLVEGCVSRGSDAQPLPRLP